MSMNNFDLAIFEFLTEPDNFNQSLKVQEHFVMVRNNLLSQFWGLVKEKLEDMSGDEKLKEMSGDEKRKWHVKQNRDLDARWSSLWLVKEKWRKEINGERMPLAISWESLTQDIHYGVWIKRESKVWDIDRMRKIGNEIAVKHKMDTDSGNWPVKYYHKYNFNSNQNLRHILPTSRDETADEFAKLLWEIATTYETELDRMYDMTK